ncbi:TPA: DUF2345 domain-containing protein, partial [Pseudomonas putida]|nr:DUF2345 domain-containing protein [Pseudomonas putida]
SVVQSISLFAQNAGAKLFAANGKVELEAQSDAMELTALQNMKLTSLEQLIEMSAQKEILLTSGGAYIRIKGSNIEVHAPGTIDIKGAKKTLDAPASMEHSFKKLASGPDSMMYDEQNKLMTGSGIPLDNVAVEVDIPGKDKRVYFTDQDGHIPRFFNDAPSAAKVRLTPDEFVVPADAEKFVPRIKS